MNSWIQDILAHAQSLWEGLDARAILVFLGQKLAEGLIEAASVVLLGWLVVYRQWRQLTQGRSDQVVFSANLLTAINESTTPNATPKYVLQLRTVLPPKTIDQILDNVALRRSMRQLAEAATLADPILATEGTAGFEIVNDIVNSVSGALASAPFPRESWLMALTCEDRRFVRKCCIRVLLVRQADLANLASWSWCIENLLVERWYHYWRIITLHQIARRYVQERANQQQGRDQDARQNLLPLVDAQAHHPRIRLLSLGIHTQEPILESPVSIDWPSYLPKIAELGLALTTVEAPRN